MPRREEMVLTSDETRARRRLRRCLAPVAVVLAVVVGSIPAAAVGVGTAAAAPPPTADRPVFVLPESGEMLSAFNRGDYDEQDGSPEQVASPDIPGRQALRFSLDGGDQRTELRPRVAEQTDGDVQYYTYSALLDRDFPTGVDDFQVVLQWHHQGDSGSPPIAIEVRRNRVMLVSEGEDYQDLGPVSGGDRINLTMRVAFSQDAEEGTVDVWRDGRPALRGFRPPGGTLLDEGNYLKLGLYRSTSIDDPGELWLEDFRVGPTLASVEPPGSISPPVAEDVAATADDAPPDSSPDAVTWVAGALLLGVVAIVIGVMRRQRAGR